MPSPLNLTTGIVFLVPGATIPASSLTFTNGTVLADSALGTITMTSSAATNGFRIPNGSNAEYGGMAWTSNVFELGVTTNGGTNRNVRIKAVGGAISFQGPSDTSILNTTLGIWSKLNNTTLAGLGTPIIVAAGRVTAQSAANASIATFTVGAADGSFHISANMNVTVVTTLVTTLTCTYTDESNTARTMIFPIQQLSGSFVAAGAITGLGAWESPVLHIRAKAATAITILTSAGTFTGVTYTAEGIIKQLA